MLAILDRDGVINYDSNEYIKSPEEWQPIPGSLKAIAQLNQAGYQVVIATNQSGVGRGLYSEKTLKKIHEKMLSELKKMNGHLDGIFYCPHHPDENCECRKPKPGMLHQIAKQFNIDLSKHAILIGDSRRDIQAAHAVHCKAILINANGNPYTDMTNVNAYATLSDAVEMLLEE